MKVTFDNVRISIEAPDAESAYKKLCEGLEQIKDCKYVTDTFSDDTRRDEDTCELWPQHN